MYKKSMVHYITKILVDIMFYSGIICVIAVPFISRYISMFYGYHGHSQMYMSIVLVLSGICAVYILFNLKQMYKTLLSGNPFIAENVVHLRKIAAACMIIALIYAVKCIFMFTITTMIIIVIFIIGCLFCLTLKDLFKQAVNFKEENELTI